MCLLVLILFAGCGLKGNPAPVGSAFNREAGKITFAAAIKYNTVELTWGTANENDGRVKIEKSELGTSGNICKDCPRTYKGIADLTPKSEKRFVDKAVEKGKSYSYRLNLCDETGTCRPSQTVDVDLK